MQDAQCSSCVLRTIFEFFVKANQPITQAIRVLKQKNADFTLRPYRYQEKGGTEVASRELGMDEHQVIKTLVMEDDRGNPFLVLMHGDREVSTKNLARIMGVKTVKPCDPDTAHRLTGYMVGGISPFGTRKSLPVYLEETILELPTILINAGKRGLLAEIAPGELVRVLNPAAVRVAI
ncbi:MAG: Cys-tRNA(Pro) deacylase [Deltaproteobacteria bacterium HGW-Deltaproteobacteria-21]|nr:MAG: Cys-tRNA(Pro) deacylase [Deltaproteobacteria bacterium HGW-Deltaproteobacteria-21]